MEKLKAATTNAVAGVKKGVHKVDLQAEITKLTSDISKIKQSFGENVWDFIEKGDMNGVQEAFNKVRAEYDQLNSQLTEKKKELDNLEQ